MVYGHRVRTIRVLLRNVKIQSLVTLLISVKNCCNVKQIKA